MASSYSSILHLIRTRPYVSFIAGSTAYCTGHYLHSGTLPFTTPADPPSLNTSTFTQYTLVAKARITESSSLFVLRPPASEKATSLLARIWDPEPGTPDSLWSVQAKQPQLQIGREYTPLPRTGTLASILAAPRDIPTPTVVAIAHNPGPPAAGPDAAAADLHLLIRREKNGEMTTYLDGLPLASTVALRGPYADVRIPDEVDEVLFLAGGTGIAPALQVARIMAKRPAGRVRILWANRKGDECVGAPVQESQQLQMRREGWWAWPAWLGLRVTKKEDEEEKLSKKPRHKGLMVKVLEDMQTEVPEGRLQVEYFVDEEDSFIRSREVKQIIANKPNTGVNGAKLIMVSGPSGFVDYWAGKKRLDQGHEKQGPVEGRLGQMDLNGWKVWKF